MKPKTLILMVVAIVCGLAASYMTSRVIAERTTKDTDEEKVAVLVAKQNLTMGTLIKDPQLVFEEKQFTKGEEPKKAIRSFDELKDRRLNRPLGAEQFVTADDLMGKDQVGLAGMMQKGKRGIGLKVNIEGAVAGFVLPHSRVDIISVVRRNENETYSKIILQNVLVLAVDQVQQRPDDKAALPSNTVTVQVSPAEAEKLSLATELGGPLRLILRSFGDEESVTTPGATPKGLLQSGSGKSEDGADGEGPLGGQPLVAAPKVPSVPAAPEVKPPEPPPVKTHVMNIYNGDALTRAVFVLGDRDSEMKIEKSQPEPAPLAQLPPGLLPLPVTGPAPATKPAPVTNTAPRPPAAKP